MKQASGGARKDTKSKIVDVEKSSKKFPSRPPYSEQLLPLVTEMISHKAQMETPSSVDVDGCGGASSSVDVDGCGGASSAVDGDGCGDLFDSVNCALDDGKKKERKKTLFIMSFHYKINVGFKNSSIKLNV